MTDPADRQEERRVVQVAVRELRDIAERCPQMSVELHRLADELERTAESR